MQFQLEPRESFAKFFEELLRIEMMFEAKHEVVSIAHDDDVTMPIAPPPLLNPQVERTVQTDVGQQRRHRCPLRGADFRCYTLTLFHHPGSQPFLDEPQNPTIRNAVLDKLDQPPVVDGVEEPADIRIEHPVYLLAHDSDRQRIKRIVRSASRPKAIREAAKVALVNGVHHFNHGALQDFILHRRDAEWPLPAISLRDVHPTRGLRTVRSAMHPGMQVPKILFEPLTVVLPRDMIDSRCRILLRSQVRLTQPIHAHMVQERRKPFPLICLCSFAYTFERTYRLDPALSPGRVLLVRVPLNRIPSLRNLRRRSFVIVRLLRRYYGPVRLPTNVHLRCAANGLSGAARRTIRGRRQWDLPVLAHEGSTHVSGLRPRRAIKDSRLRLCWMLPSASLNSVGTLVDLISRLNTEPVCAPVNTSRTALRLAAHDSGSSWVATPSM